MRITERLISARPAFSFEFFPPKTDEGEAALMRTAETLRRFEPAVVSVTYGAGGSTRSRSVAVAKRIKHELDLEVMAHVTCVGSTVDDLRELFDDLEQAGIENILALRGRSEKHTSALPSR